MGRYTMSSRTGRVFTVVLAVILGLALGASPVTLRDVSASLSLLALSVVVFWRPTATVSDEGIEVVNPLKRYRVSWQAIRLIDTRLVLTLRLDTGKIAVHAGVGPGRHTTVIASKERGQHLPESTYRLDTIQPGDLVGTESGDIAAIARRFWEAHRDDPDPGVWESRWDRIGVSLLLLAIVAAVISAGLSF